jgi:hypothetical protein
MPATSVTMTSNKVASTSELPFLDLASFRIFATITFFMYI